jgi:Lipocalin-like domain
MARSNLHHERAGDRRARPVAPTQQIQLATHGRFSMPLGFWRASAVSPSFKGKRCQCPGSCTAAKGLSYSIIPSGRLRAWIESEADRMLTWLAEHSMFPNWTGTAQKRKIELSGDELKYLVANPETARSNPVVVWKWAK